SYLLTCLRRELIAEMKMETNRMRGNKLFQDAAPQEESSYEEYLVQLQHNKELKERLAKALDQLTQREKELMKLKFFEDLDYDETAARGNITKRTAYNIIHAALKTLKASVITAPPLPGVVIYNPALLAVVCCLLFL